MSELRRFLKERLPDFMVPAGFVLLESLPISPNGKLDRRALPAPGAGASGPEDDYVAPRTPVEELLATIWATVLRVDRVGVHSNFFELGGHSLMATQVISRIAASLGVELPLRAIFEAPTVAELAARIIAAQSSDPVPQAPALARVKRETYRSTGPNGGTRE
jgi:acyl carrier protein